MKAKIYTLSYQPFVMGGDVWQPIAATVEVDGPYEIGGGYKAYVAEAPNGKIFVAEEQSGALIGPSLEEVREDVRTGDIDIMKQQVADAIVQSKNAEIIEEEEFWRRLKCLKD